MQEWAPDDLFLKELYGAYREEHEAANADYVSQTPWSYGCYASGEAVRTDIRQAWREHKDEMAVFGNQMCIRDREYIQRQYEQDKAGEQLTMPNF